MRTIPRGYLANVWNMEGHIRPLEQFIRRYDEWTTGFTSANEVLYQVISGGSADTDGSWLEYIQSAEQDIYLLELICKSNNFTSGVNSSGLLDVAVGASGSEVEIVSDVQVGHMYKGMTIKLPVFIPKGSRVALRARGAVAGRAYSFNQPKIMNGGFVVKPAPYLTTYGSVPSSSRGTVLTVPGSLNTKGAWTELTAATTERLMALLVCVGSGSNNMVAQDILLDIGVGASGQERVVIPDIHHVYNAIEYIELYGFPRLYQVDIPAGSRIAARWQRSAVTVNNHNCHVVGVPWRA